MQFLNVRGAVTAAAMLFVSLCSAAPSAAFAQAPAGVTVVSTTPIAAATPAAPIVAAATPAQSGAAWISQGIAVAPNPAQPVGAIVGTVSTAPIQAASLMQLVGDMPVATDLTADLKCLAQAVYFESRGEPIEGQLAVAEVVINRAKSGLYPDNYCDVITQPAQFSFVRHGRIPTADETSVAWQRAEAIAQIAQQNLWQSKAADALYFHATYVNPSWAHQKVELAQIDTHIFYR